jgi:3-oxoacyl-[acyl-carrier protein] reductase
LASPNRYTILISGGSRGLGQAIVSSLLQDDAQVATFSRKATPFIEQAERDFSERFYYRPLDASDNLALREFVREVHRRFGRVDALINNAAVAVDGVLALAREEDLQRMLDINLKAALILAKECSRLMLHQGQGSIVNIASIIAERGFSGLVGYAATKAGMIGMTHSLARELGPRNIRVNALAPGYLETEMSQSLDEQRRAQIVRRTPLGRLGTAHDVVPWVRFLLRPEAGFVTGQVITIDGGASV